MFKPARDILSPDRPWLYLLYLGFFYFRWIYQPPGLVEALVSIVAMTGFILLYVIAHRRMDWTLPVVAVLATVLGFTFIPTNMGGAVYVAFAGAMLARWPDIRWRLGMLAALAIAVIGVGLAMNMPLYFIAAVLLFSGLAAGGAAMAARRERQDAASDEQQAQAAVMGAEAERRRIARDLHDLLGHTLSVVALKADLANRLYDSDPERARTELSEIQSISREALAEVREAVTGLKGRDLAQAVAEARARLEAAGLSVVTDLPDDLPLEPAAAATLAMVVREGATNILRHAGAGRAEIRVALDAGSVDLVIEDNGRGGADPDGGGLSGLAARLAEAGGDLSLDRTGPGTRLTARLPLTESGHA